MTKTPTTSELDIGALYQRYYPMVARRVRQFVPPSDVEEVTHEVFLRAIERRDSFRAQSTPVTWLYRTATNHCINWVRDRKNRRRLIERFGPSTWAQSHETSPDTLTFLQDVWRELDPELATIGIYFYLDGLSQADIAQALGYSERTIAYRLKDLTRIVREREART